MTVSMLGGKEGTEIPLNAAKKADPVAAGPATDEVQNFSSAPLLSPQRGSAGCSRATQASGYRVP
jgi:hypothetical protein